MNNEYLLFLDFQRIERQVERTDSHDEDGAEGTHKIGHIAHAKREDGSSEQSHDHQTGDLVLVLGVVVERLRETDREDIRVTESDEGDTGIEGSLRMTHGEQNHRCDNHAYGDSEEGFRG